MSDTLCKTAHTLVSVSEAVEQEGTGPNKPCMKPAGTRKCVKRRSQIKSLGRHPQYVSDQLSSSRTTRVLCFHMYTCVGLFLLIFITQSREGGLRVEEAADQRKKKQTEQTHETKPELKTGLQHKLH